MTLLNIRKMTKFHSGMLFFGSKFYIISFYKTLIRKCTIPAFDCLAFIMLIYFMEQTNYRQLTENNWLFIFRKLEHVSWKFNIENYTEGKSKMEPLVLCRQI